MSSTFYTKLDEETLYSSLRYLHRLPVDNLKIDRSFVDKMILGGNNLELVNTMVTLAEKMKMKVIAEGIETMEQVTMLEDLHCAYGQGYLFSKPINREGVEVLLDTMEQVSKWQLKESRQNIIG